MSRRNFVAGAAAASALVAAGATSAMAATSSATADAMAEGEKKASSGAAASAGVDDSYVISLKNGRPKWSFEIPPAPSADAASRTRTLR